MSTPTTLKTLMTQYNVPTLTSYLDSPLFFMNLILIFTIMGIVSWKINSKQQSNYEYLLLVMTIFTLIPLISQMNIIVLLFMMLVCLATGILAYFQNKETADKESLKYNELMLACIALISFFLLINLLFLFVSPPDVETGAENTQLAEDTQPKRQTWLGYFSSYLPKSFRFWR